ncbi:LOW QUALITY PROTEIN: Pol protein [Phytophthora palmivora]|uniref:Pol protein n=1 Tax=Phytophthora palmivora TaxID=4796 RepID=A0A2P4XGQ6_9STRA|nr:LOW QUALITY PROTEIN: Pol protein [Phytophthora palmivora]
MSEGEAFGPRLGSATEPTCASGLLPMSLDFVFGLPSDDKGNTRILVFVCRLSKMHYLAPIRDKVTGNRLHNYSVFRYHVLPETIVSDRAPRFTGAFWDTLSQTFGTKLTMSTADHPPTDGQTERVNRVLEDTIRCIYAEVPWSWSNQLSMLRLHSTMRHTHQRDLPVLFEWELAPTPPSAANYSERQLMPPSRARDAMGFAQQKRKEYSDKKSRGNLNVFYVGDLVLLNTKNLPQKVVSSFGSNKLKHLFIGSWPKMAPCGLT